MAWLHKLLLTILYWPTRLLVRTKAIPTDVQQELGIDRAIPIIYLLHTHSATDQLVLAQAARRLGLPDPSEPIRLNHR